MGALPQTPDIGSRSALAIYVSTCAEALFKSLSIIDETSLNATALREPLPVDHEYSWRKARWVPQV